MDPILLRFIERLTVVLIGGMAIYLGYRLFRAVPEQRDSAGKLVLPWDVSIVLTRVGPGVFFALFGVVAVGLSLLRPLQVGAAGDPGQFSYAGGTADRSAVQRADARALMRREMALLNSLPRQLPEAERAAAERGITRIKLALLTPHWGTPAEGFGDFAAFAAWAENGGDGPEPDNMQAALALWRYGQSEP
jgi:hypothetical protein